MLAHSIWAAFWVFRYSDGGFRRGVGFKLWANGPGF
jgi:hypothetical protein